MDMEKKPPVSALQADEHRFAIILGAGAAGIIQGCSFIREKVLPLEEFHILDRNGAYGGVWWRNTYPGAACDIPSHEYQISWALNPYWSRTFAPQPEIREYFESVALRYHLDKSTTFNTEIVGATWDDSRLLWLVETIDLKTDTRKIWSCHVLISAAGAFTVPKKANVPGIDTFKGEQWHSIDWPKKADLRDKTVAVIGTGPSACQFIPNIYPDVKSLIVYQRSPGHVLPRVDTISGWFKKFLFANFPFTMRLHRWFLMKKDEILRKRIFNPNSWLHKQVIAMTKKHLYNQVKDETLRQKLESNDVFGCKRPMILDNYFPIFSNDNVELVTDSVTEITEEGIISMDAKTGDETERKTDVLIWGTGYNPVDFGLPVPTRGRTGQLLAEKYQPELQSLYGVAVDDFPNYFNFLGPNSSSFETSVMELFELQAHHTCLVTEFLFKKNVGSFRYAIMPKEERVTEWTLSLRPGQAKLPPANPLCRSYYRSKIGHVYRFPYPYWIYKALIAKIDFKRDWVLLQNRIGQKDVQILEFVE
ncbi:hypothetical protein sscle_05g042560 [Sclerotinia sclerotiorum 1980 UF-70]|uniref:FAD/NAD(P)-binding domain-containing protein n=1 Tax=Sclerotinia sclerotiorum (strain ATCC 18683 / 1980 / Ss-1) TaxID=665079 RepID=A0A1D9Q3K8_SCLS1|nr:hypothetical protein sscle_05g042560 [Sclerotinia sclerotiorum 1980 UF-70]